MKDIDAVPSNVQSARQEALLYVFEDNEAVIKMIIKGRSPTMRHVSRTHPVVLLERNLYGHPLAGLLWETQFEEILLALGWVHRKQGFFLSVHVDDIKMVGKKQNMAPIWKELMKKRGS